MGLNGMLIANRNHQLKEKHATKTRDVANKTGVKAIGE